jgi:hypothetical protein
MMAKYKAEFVALDLYYLVFFIALKETKKKLAYTCPVETWSTTRNGERFFSLTSKCGLLWMRHMILEVSNDGTNRN